MQNRDAGRVGQGCQLRSGEFYGAREAFLFEKDLGERHADAPAGGISRKRQFPGWEGRFAITIVWGERTLAGCPKGSIVLDRRSSRKICFLLFIPTIVVHQRAIFPTTCSAVEVRKATNHQPPRNMTSTSCAR